MELMATKWMVTSMMLILTTMVLAMTILHGDVLSGATWRRIQVVT